MVALFEVLPYAEGAMTYVFIAMVIFVAIYTDVWCMCKISSKEMPKP